MPCRSTAIAKSFSMRHNLRHLRRVRRHLRQVCRGLHLRWRREVERQRNVLRYIQLRACHPVLGNEEANRIALGPRIFAGSQRLVNLVAHLLADGRAVFAGPRRNRTCSWPRPWRTPAPRWSARWSVQPDPPAMASSPAHKPARKTIPGPQPDCCWKIDRWTIVRSTAIAEAAISKHKKKAGIEEFDRIVLNVMRKPCLQV